MLFNRKNKRKKTNDSLGKKRGLYYRRNRLRLNKDSLDSFSNKLTTKKYPKSNDKDKLKMNGKIRTWESSRQRPKAHQKLKRQQGTLLITEMFKKMNKITITGYASNIIVRVCEHVVKINVDFTRNHSLTILSVINRQII